MNITTEIFADHISEKMKNANILARARLFVWSGDPTESTSSKIIEVTDILIRRGRDGTPWVSFPSRTYVDREGQTKYAKIIKFFPDQDPREPDSDIRKIESYIIDAYQETTRNSTNPPPVPTSASSVSSSTDEDSTLSQW